MILMIATIIHDSETFDLERIMIKIVQGGQLEVASDSVSDISKESSYASKVFPHICV